MEKIVTEIGARFVKGQQKSGKSKETALESLNVRMRVHGLPQFKFDENRIVLNALYTGSYCTRLAENYSKIFDDIEGTKDDENTFLTFQAAYDGLKAWESGNGLSLIPASEKAKTRKACEAFFSSYVNNKTFQGTVTPYVHLMTSHMPDMLDNQPNLQRFSQQSVEHWMGVLQRAFREETNKQVGRRKGTRVMLDLSSAYSSSRGRQSSFAARIQNLLLETKAEAIQERGDRARRPHRLL